MAEIHFGKSGEPPERIWKDGEWWVLAPHMGDKGPYYVRMSGIVEFKYEPRARTTLDEVRRHFLQRLAEQTDREMLEIGLTKHVNCRSAITGTFELTPEQTDLLNGILGIEDTSHLHGMSWREHDAVR